jgi:hypothetical protein
MTNSELIASAQVVLDNLNANLEASHNTTGTFISGRLIFAHIDKYHHQDMHPTPSIDRLEVTNASTATVDLVAEFNAIVAQLHEAHIDVTGNIVYSHQSPNGTPTLRSEELYNLNIEFTDETENIQSNAATKLPIDPSQNSEHIKAVAEGQARYDQMLASGAFVIPPEHYRPGWIPPTK